MTPTYRSDIDGLRAVAVLLVIGFHAFPKYIVGGFIGVDVFFVISGFLISSIIFGGLERGTFSFVNFYVRRIKRIFPALAVVLAASLIAGWLLLFPIDYRDVAKHTAAGAGFFPNFAYLKEAGYFDAASEEKPLLHLWSLGIEEQFYIVWPALIVLAWRWRYAPLIITSIILVVSLLWNVILTRTNTDAAFYLPITRFWELMLGCVLALTISVDGRKPNLRSYLWPNISSLVRRHRSAINEVAAWLGITLIVIGVALIKRERPFPGWWALLPTLGTVLIIVAGQASSLNRLLSYRWLVYVGLISYPLYLWHWPILAYARIVRTSEPTVLMKVAAIIAAFALAYLTYKFVEKPIRFGARTVIKPIVASGALAATGTLALFILYHEGLPWRFPNTLQNLSKDSGRNTLVAYRYGSCLLDTTATFPNECDGDVANGPPSVVLWGDSYAAHLFPGLNELRQKGRIFRLAQYTSFTCPPILTFVDEKRPQCLARNNLVIQKNRVLETGNDHHGCPLGTI